MRGMLLGAALAFTFAATPAIAQDKGNTQKIQPSEVQSLLKKLGAEDYDTRETATMDLIKKGKAAAAAVKKLHDETKDPEVKNRCAHILKKLDGGLKAPKSKDRSLDPQKKGIQGQPLPGVPGIPGMPDMGEMFKDMPEGFKKIFEGLQQEIQKELQQGLKDMMNPNGAPPAPGKPRIRVWSNVPGFNKKQQEGAKKAPRSVVRTRAHVTGLGTKPLDAALKTHLQLKGDGGVIVTKVKDGRWGATSGIKLHDILLTVDGQGVTSLDDLDILIKKEAKAQIIRGGKKITIKLPKRTAPATPKKDRDF
jgi:hypothetical protein